MTDAERAILRRTDGLIADLQQLREAQPANGRELALAITKAQEAKHWLLHAWSE